jgi:hypothetical protein
VFACLCPGKKKERWVNVPGTSPNGVSVGRGGQSRKKWHTIIHDVWIVPSLPVHAPCCARMSAANVEVTCCLDGPSSPHATLNGSPEPPSSRCETASKPANPHRNRNLRPKRVKGTTRRTGPNAMRAPTPADTHGVSRTLHHHLVPSTPRSCIQIQPPLPL